MHNIIDLYGKELSSLGIEVVKDTTGSIDQDYDIIHGHYALTRPVLKAFFKARAKRIPFIIHHHGSDIRRIDDRGAVPILPHHRAICSAVRRGADMALLSTPDLLEWVNGFYIPNPVDLDRFKPMNIEKTHRTLLFGRFASRELLLPLLDKDKEYDMLNWGVDMKLPKNVRKIPFQPNERLPDLFNRYEKMIGPLTDPVSLGRLEAMACGLKTYTDFPKKYTVFYGFEDPDEVDDPRRFVQKYHSPKAVADILVSVYKELIR